MTTHYLHTRQAKKYPPLLLKYLKMFQEDPRSRIFAPLAECYRKIGLVDEAIEICLEGLAVHPYFSGGKVALARAYFDKKNYDKVRELLKPVVEEMPDNLLAQKLLGDASLLLGHLNESLHAYKMLLYFNPNDEDVRQVVQELETKSYEAGGLLKMSSDDAQATPVTSPEKMRKIFKLQMLMSRFKQASPL